MAPEKVGDGYASSHEETGYALTRLAGKLETIFILYNEYGAQSSITSVASYRSRAGAQLTRDVMIPALKQLVAEHYALRLVAVHRAREGHATHEELWEGQLQTFDLDRVVEFVSSDEANLQTLIEATHNEWLDASDHQLPLWRLKVVNGRHVIWYYNHFVADGIAGYAFQRNLLKILNGRPLEWDGDSRCNLPSIDPPRRWSEGFPKSLSLVKLLWELLLMYLVRLVFRSSLLFGNLVFDPKPVEWSDTPQHLPRCKTCLYTLRMPSDLMNDILSCCKARGVTFGALLHTVAVSSAAKDLYPKARLGLTAMPINLRPFAVPAQSAGSLLNSVSSNMRIQYMRPYREAATAPPGTKSQVADTVTLDPDKVWEVARAYRRDLQAKLDGLKMVNGLLSFELTGSSIREIFAKVMPMMWMHQRYYLSISNLGAFSPYESPKAVDGEAQWWIEDVQFSAATVGSKWGFITPTLNVASMDGGDCVINAVMEEGAMSGMVVQEFLANIKRRFELLVDLEHRKDM